MTNLISGPYVPHDDSQFSSLKKNDTSPDSWTYIPDRVLEKLRERMQEWTAQAIRGPAAYASPGEPPLSWKNVL